MPLYDFKCLECGGIKTQVLTISKRNDPENCECGGKTERTYPQGGAPNILKIVPHIDWNLNRG